MTEPELPGLSIDRAGPDDLPGVVDIYSDDADGGHGDGWSEATAPVYRAVFGRILANPDYALYVARMEGRIVGTYLLHIVETLVGVGGKSCTLHSVGVAAACRGKGIGRAMLAAAEAQARARGAKSLRLTSSQQRQDAHRFYARAGYSERYKSFSKRL